MHVPHSKRPIQLPRSASGNRLCRHRAPGSCTHFCQYKLFTKIVTGVVLALTAMCTALALSTPDGAERVRDTVLAVGIFLAVIIPGVVIANRNDPD